jgi:hypothetical protein
MLTLLPNAQDKWNPVYYRQSFVMRYVTGALTEPSTCRTNYEAQLNIQWSTIMLTLLPNAQDKWKFMNEYVWIIKNLPFLFGFRASRCL